MQYITAKRQVSIAGAGRLANRKQFEDLLTLTMHQQNDLLDALPEQTNQHFSSFAGPDNLSPRTRHRLPKYTNRQLQTKTPKVIHKNIQMPKPKAALSVKVQK